MNYELEKRLKDAGFPIEYECDDCGIHLDAFHSASSMKPIPPTLSELIEACGDDFNNLYKSPSGWEAKGWQRKYEDSNSDQMICGGSTPEEAVANLWLALNKK